MLRRAGLVALLSCLAVALHEGGHRLAYAALGHPASMSFQRVRPQGFVPPAHDLAAKAAGPLVSLLAGAALLAVARRRRTFGWAAASFTNASLRLFPLAMDLTRAFRGGKPFSDEGEVGLHLGARMPTLLAFALASLVLTALAARALPVRRRGLAAALIFAEALAIGIAAVVADDLLGLN